MSSIPFDSSTSPQSSSSMRPMSRKLNEGVLQSAEEAVINELDDQSGLVRPGMEGFSAETWDSVIPDKDGVYDVLQDKDEDGLSRYPVRKANAVKRFVAMRPGQSAMAAAAAGALAMIVLRSQLRRLTWGRGKLRRR